MIIQIDKGIPVPSASGRRAKRYPFEDMQIGDSFLAPLEVGKSAGSIYASISQARKRLNINLTSARVEGGIRIWRIELQRPEGK